jgi:uncharacterized membrane protein YbhN (UPF0104 family)
MILDIKKIFIHFGPWVVIGAVALFFIRTLSDNWHRLDTINFSLSVWGFMGVILFMLAVVLSGILWGRLLMLLSSIEISISDSIRIHSASWLLKYIPGQVGSYLNKIAWGNKKGISKKTVSTSFIYENVLMVVAGFILSMPVVFLFQTTISNNINVYLLLLMIVPLTVVMSKRIFYLVLNKVATIFKREPFSESDFLTNKDLIKYQLGYLFPRVLNGVGFVLIVQSLLPVSPAMYVGLGATYILASILGLLAFFTPGGLGVREAVIVVLVSVYFTVDQAVVVAIIVRLYATLSDVGVAMVYLGLNKGMTLQR